MKTDVYICADALVSPLGRTTGDNWAAMVRGACGIKRHQGVPGFPDAFWGARIPDEWLPERTAWAHLTRFERLLVSATEIALHQAGIDPAAPEVAFVVATAKGNIDLINPEQPHAYAEERVYLWKSAQMVTEYFGNPYRPVVVSQACIYYNSRNADMWWWRALMCSAGLRIQDFPPCRRSRRKGVCPLMLIVRDST